MKMMVDELMLRGETSARANFERETEIVRARLFPHSEALIVSASAASTERMRAALVDEIGCHIQTACSAEEAIALVDRNVFDAVLIDHDLGNADPLRLGSRVRTRPETRQTATLLVVRGNDSALAAKALEIGFNDYISAPVDLVELVARMRLQLRRKHYADQLRENMRNSVVEAQTDPLTGLYNRRYADMHLEAMIERCQRRRSQLTVMMLDLDRFKRINDEHGHAAGDMVLSEFTRRLQLNVRSIDLVARVGGEEFMVVLPDTDPEHGRRDRRTRPLGHRRAALPDLGDGRDAGHHRVDRLCRPAAERERVRAAQARRPRALRLEEWRAQPHHAGGRRLTIASTGVARRFSCLRPDRFRRIQPPARRFAGPRRRSGNISIRRSSCIFTPNPA